MYEDPNNKHTQTPQTPPSNEQVPESNTPPPPDETEERSIGSLIGIVIIIVILVIGGLYFWGKQINDAQTPEEIATQSDPQTQSLKQQGSSDDIESIENDLEATQLNNLDAELEDMEQEMENI